uniref:WD_REPEATS_REGION domain-containing protein n=1 Tax=Caenorhabditis tropicalis TaxID=1561998 RepID=A0A1I7TA75_9PELO
MGCDHTKKGHLEDISALDIDDGDQMIIFGSHSGSVSVANYKNLGREKWKKPMTLKLQKHALKTIKWCPIDLRLFMVTSAANWMRICDAPAEKVINSHQFDGDVHFDWNQHNTSEILVDLILKKRKNRVGMSLPSIIRWEDVVMDAVQWFPSKHHYVYVARRDGKVGVFDVRSTRGVLAEKKIHYASVFEMRFSSDGSRLVTADRSGHIHVADTWDLSTKSQFHGTPAQFHHRRPSMELMENQGDLYLAVNLDRLTIVKFPGHGGQDYDEIDAKVLWDKPMVFRKSSYELITGHQYNYLNLLTRRNDGCTNVL